MKKLDVKEYCALADLKECKRGVYYFLVAEREMFPGLGLFTISDLYNDTNGIVRVYVYRDMLINR